MNAQTKEYMMEIIGRHIGYSEPEVLSTEYCRDILVDVIGTEIRINCWKNISYLFIGEIQIPFTELNIDSCWPNKFTNINFYRNGEKVAIVPIK